MVSRVLKALTSPFATSRPSNLREGVMDFLGGAVGRVAFRYQMGLEVRDKVLTPSGALGRKYRISEQRVYVRQPYYTLVDVATGTKLGLFHQDSIEPYSPVPSR
jgi:hypothetical protein